jgi:hypothetical protein
MLQVGASGDVPLPAPPQLATAKAPIGVRSEAAREIE